MSIGYHDSLAGIRGGKILVIILLSTVSVGFAKIILVDTDTAIALTLALCLGFFVVKRPAVGILLILASTSTIISPRVLPRLSIAGADVQFTELMIGMTLGIILFRDGIRPSLRRCFRSRLMLPLLIFLALIALSVIHTLSTYSDLTLTAVVARSRQFSYYTLFIPTLLCLKTEEDLRFFVRGLILLMVLVSLYFILTAVFGQTYLHYILHTGVWFALTNVDTGNISDLTMRNARMRGIPGTALIVTMFFLAVCLFIYHTSARGRVSYGLASALATVPILLTFTRTTWATTLLFILVLWVVAKARFVRLTRLGFLMIGVFLIGFLALAFHPKYSNIIELTTDRFMSFFEENVEASTAIARIIEMKAAVEVLTENPLTGLGVGGEIVKKTIEYEGNKYVLSNRFNIHNSFMALALKAGIPALVVLLFMYYRAMRGGWTTFRESGDPYLKAVSLGVFLSLGRSFLNAFSQAYFIESSMIPCLIVCFAIIESIRIGSRQSTAGRGAPHAGGADVVKRSFGLRRECR